VNVSSRSLYVIARPTKNEVSTKCRVLMLYRSRHDLAAIAIPSAVYLQPVQSTCTRGFETRYM